MNESIPETTEAILSCLRANRLLEARQKTEDALRSFPNQRDIHLLGSKIYRILNNRELSLQLCQNLIDHNPADWEALGRVAEDLKMLDRCEAWVELGAKVRASLPDDIQPYLQEKEQLKFIGSCLADNPLRVQIWTLTLRTPEPCDSQETLKRLEKAHTRPTSRMIPFQYWSQGDLPAALQEISNQWNSILKKLGLPPLTCYDKQRAREWIKDNKPAFLRPFDSAYHYAIESDVFRAAFASHTETLYLDCDSYPTPLTESILNHAMELNSSVLYFRTHRPALANGFFISAKDCPFFKLLASKIEDVDFTGKPKDWRFLYKVGPWIYTKTMDQLMASESFNLSPDSPPPGVPRLDFGSFSLGFVAEKHACLASPPFSVQTHEWSRWQSCLPRQGLRRPD